ncbi:MAG TPA: hypothetical protein VNS32_09865, partial [Flavisolibacter sp.]|nr:hypothetical protein [Flavisolibacter sp.]
GPGSWRGNPTLLDDHHVLFTTNQNHVFKVSVDDGTVVHFWSVPPTEKLKPYLNILKKDGQLFIGADFGIHIVDAVTGQTLRELKDTIFTYAVTSNTIYLRKLLGVVQAKDLATFTTKWTWRSPLKHYVDSSNYYGVIDPKTSCLVSDDQYVYYYEMTPTGTSQIFNSIYILNAQTGALVKEIKLPTSYPVPVLGINQMVVRGNKAYRPVSNFIRFDW